MKKIVMIVSSVMFMGLMLGLTSCKKSEKAKTDKVDAAVTNVVSTNDVVKTK